MRIEFLKHRRRRMFGVGNAKPVTVPTKAKVQRVKAERKKFTVCICIGKAIVVKACNRSEAMALAKRQLAGNPPNVKAKRLPRLPFGTLIVEHDSRRTSAASRVLRKLRLAASVR
jgi:hypothetical protein